MLAFEPPPASIDAVEVELDIFVGDFEGLDLLSVGWFLFRQTYFGHDLLYELTTLHLEFGLDVVG